MGRWIGMRGGIKGERIIMGRRIMGRGGTGGRGRFDLLSPHGFSEALGGGILHYMVLVVGCWVARMAYGCYGIRLLRDLGRMGYGFYGWDMASVVDSGNSAEYGWDGTLPFHTRYPEESIIAALECI